MGGGSGLSRMMSGGEGGGASKRLIGSRSRSRREIPGAGEVGGVDGEGGGKKKKVHKRVVMTRGTTGMGMAIKTDLSTAAQNWNENVNVSRVAFHFSFSSRPMLHSLASSC